MSALPESWGAFWRGLARHERPFLRRGTAALVATLLVLVAVVPAVRTLHNTPPRQKQLDSVLLQMRALQVRAQALETQPRLGRDEVLQTLQASLRLLGDNVQMAINDQRATLTLQATRPDALAQWLIYARVNARAVPVEARLIRSGTATEARWDGTLVMSLPAR